LLLSPEPRQAAPLTQEERVMMKAPEARGVSGGDQPAVDEGVLATLLEEVADGDTSVLVDLIDSYLVEAVGQVDAIAAAAEASDAATVSAVAHSLKSASAALGAGRLADLLKRVELTAKEPGTDLAALASPVRPEFDQVAESLRRLRPGD
jgi:HPt (histidine-containing phosphotransfer) domain-containing protein